MKKFDVLCISIFLMTPLLYFKINERISYSQYPKLIFLFLCILLLMLFIVIDILTIKCRLKNKCVFVMILYFSMLVISILNSNNALLGLTGSYNRIEGLSTHVIYFYLLILGIIVPTKSVVRFALIGSVVVSMIGILQVYGFDVLPQNYITEGWTNVAYSTIGNPNFLGSYLVLVLPIAMYEYVGLKKWYGIPIYGLLFYCLLATMSRGPWLGAMFAFGSFAFLMWKYGKFDLKRFSVLVVLSLSLILLFNGTSNGALLSRFKTIGNDIGEVVSGGENIEQAGSYRMFIWIRSFELVKQNPIWGVGIEQLGYAFIDNYSDDMIQQFGYVGFIDRAHNEYLHIAVSSGIPSLLLYLIFLILVLREGWISLSKNSMLIPVYSAVLGYLLQAFFNISVVSVAYLFWIYLGFLVRVDTKDKTT